MKNIILISALESTDMHKLCMYIRLSRFWGHLSNFLLTPKFWCPQPKKMSQPKFQRPKSILSAASKHFLIEKMPFFTKKWPFWGALRQYLKLIQGAKIFSSQTYVPECEKKWWEPPQLWFLLRLPKTVQRADDF